MSAWEALGAAAADPEANVRRWLKLIGWQRGVPIEIQALEAPNGGRYTVNRYAHADDDRAIVALLAEAERWKAPGVFVIANTIDPAVATRSKINAWHDQGPKGANTSDGDIVSRTVLYIDFDADRPKGTSATDAQAAAAVDVADRVREQFARELGAASVGLGLSGNGAALFVALDQLASTDELTALCRGVNTAVQRLYQTKTVKVDAGLTDPKRLVPAFGTTKRKGAPDIADRPHRRTALLVPEVVSRVGLADLERLLSALRSELTAEQNAEVDKAMGLKAKAKSTATGDDTGSVFKRANESPVVEVLRHLGKLDGDHPVCVGCGLSGDSSVAVVENGLKCSHDRCSSKGKNGFRTVVDCVVEALDVEPIEAVRRLGEWFGFEVPKKTRTRREKEAKGPQRATLVEIIDAVTAPPKLLEGRPLTLNEMTGNVELGGVPIKDAWLTELRAELERGVKLLAGAEETRRAVELVASQRPHHPVREYLSGIVWDQSSRLEDFRRALRAEDTPLVREMLTCSLVAAVARAFVPGCKVDTMPVLVGRQNMGKSRSIRALAGDWFSDTPIVIGTKDAFSQCRQAWIHEWPELESIRRARDLESVKAFLSSAADIYRPAYGHYDVRVPRSSIFVGTTNQREFLSDETGNRRFWPITVPRPIDVAAVAAMRDQLWAEAVALYRAGARWYLSDEREEELSMVHKAHEIHDAWEDPIADYVRSPTRLEVTTAEILETALKKPTGQWSTGDARRVSAIMRRLGWNQGKTSGVRTWRRDLNRADDGADGRNRSAPEPGPSAPIDVPGAKFGADDPSGADAGQMKNDPSAPSVRTDGADQRVLVAPALKISVEEGVEEGVEHTGGEVAISSAPSALKPDLNTPDGWKPPHPAAASGCPTAAQLTEAEAHGWHADMTGWCWRKGDEAAPWPKPTKPSNGARRSAVDVALGKRGH